MIVTTRPKPTAATVGLAWDGTRLWAGDFDSHSLVVLDADGTTNTTFPAPGRPVGLAFAEARLAAVISHPETDHRTIRFFDPAAGAWLDRSVRCPDDSGSQLAWDGGHLWLSQRYKKTLLQLHPDGTVKHSIDIPYEITGFYWIGATAWMNVRVEQGFSDVAKRGPGASRPALVERVPGSLASLAYDGEAFWTVDLRGESMYRIRPNR
jgi:outer membrane protein assembly factor BamB